MGIMGSAERGKSLVYRVPHRGELRLTNLTADEILEVVDFLGKPDQTCNSRLRKNQKPEWVKKIENEIGEKITLHEKENKGVR